MLEEGLSYPGWGERWTGRFVIGATLTLLGPFLLPLLPLYGYYMRAMGASARGVDRPPQWSDWLGLTVEGLRAVVTGFVYALVPNVLAGIVLAVVFTFLAGGGAVGGDPGQVIAGLGLVTLVVGALVVLGAEVVVLLLLPAALVNVAAEERLGAAFDIADVVGIATSGAYLVALVHLLFVGFVTLVVGAAASVTGVLVPAVFFWGSLAGARLLGVAHRGATGSPEPTDATYTPYPASTDEATAGADGVDVDTSTSAADFVEPDADGEPGPSAGTDSAGAATEPDAGAGEPADEGQADDTFGEGPTGEGPVDPFEDDGDEDPNDAF